jgi:hypothetical protein
VDDRLIIREAIEQYHGEDVREIVILTYSPMRLDDLHLLGTIDPAWYRREVKRGGG